MLDSDLRNDVLKRRVSWQIAIDHFTKKRLLDLAARYEDDDFSARTSLTPVDLDFKSHGTGSER